MPSKKLFTQIIMIIIVIFVLAYIAVWHYGSRVDVRLSLAQAVLEELIANKPVLYPKGAIGYAISWPQCGGAYPEMSYDYGIIGVTGGHSLSYNPCLKTELAWANKAKYAPSFYINLDYPGASINEELILSFNCAQDDEKCIAHNYGYHIAKDAHRYALAQGAIGGNWWLDVQIVSKWSLDKKWLK